MKVKAEKLTVVAELTVESAAGVETVRSFEKAWTRSWELPPPVITRFERFVHI